MRQAFDNLRPGGWLESQEFDCKDYCDDNTLSPDSPLVHWVREMGAAAEKCDRPVVMVEGVLEAYKEVGFVDVRHRVFKMPLGGWPKDERLKALGILWQRQMLQGLSGFSYWLFNRAYGRSQFQTEVCLYAEARMWIADFVVGPSQCQEGLAGEQSSRIPGYTCYIRAEAVSPRGRGAKTGFLAMYKAG